MEKDFIYPITFSKIFSSHDNNKTNDYDQLSSKKNDNYKRLFASFIITSIFMIIEGVSGWFSGSLTLISDSIHIIIDTSALFTTLLAIQLSKKRSNNHYTFGYLRLVTISVFFNSMMLIFTVLIIFFKSIYRLFYPKPIASYTMLIVAILGFILNIISFYILYSGENYNKSITLRAASIHVLGDLLGSLSTIFAVFIFFYTKWLSIDPILSILFSSLVFYSSYKLLKESLNELLEGVPLHLDIKNIKNNIICNITEISNVHHIHIWQIGEKTLITLHIQVNSLSNYNNLLCRIHNYLFTYYNINHSTIQIEHVICNKNNCIIKNNYFNNNLHNNN